MRMRAAYKNVDPALESFKVVGKRKSRAKAHRRKENPQKRGSSLRLCALAREILRVKGASRAKPISVSGVLALSRHFCGHTELV